MDSGSQKDVKKFVQSQRGSVKREDNLFRLLGFVNKMRSASLILRKLTRR